MAIHYQEQERLLTIHTNRTTYQMQVDAYGYLLHLYYGSRTEGSMNYLLTYADRGFSGNPYEADRDRTYSMDVLPQEYPCQGTGDFRSPALVVRGGDGSYAVNLKYKCHRIRDGKYGLPGLPAVYDNCAADHAQTLEVVLEDPVNGLTATLFYGVLPELDLITRAVKLENRGTEELMLEKVQSACLDFLYGDFDWITFYGRHAMERNFQRSAVGHGSQVIGSRRGTSSHQYNPFVILAEQDTTEDFGGCYGMSFVYSGAFKAEVEKDQFDQIRLSMGLQDELFCCRLKPGEVFYGPEVMMSFSPSGLGALSRNFHKACRYHLCRGKYKTSPRPVLINNWEATYFDFDGETLCRIAQQASELGVEMMVLDDGWFGGRNSDYVGLGDWQVNEAKLGMTMGELSDRIHGFGMKFGLWVEPEMISEDSELYRLHPDWAFAVPGRMPVRSRSQLVLDFSRKEVVDYIYGQISHVLDHARIEYLKWDMNRSITDVYSAAADSGEQGMVLYRYMLGVYDMLERLNSNYPDVMIEGCSGGGGRFDAGMLYYTPQIWCSDNTDAMDRIRIQYGTSFGYPISAVGAHVSAVPNHQNGRITPIGTRACVAMAGSFGYELDLSRITEEEKQAVKEQVRTFHKLWDVIHNGDYYRLTNPYKQELAAWMFAKEDGSEAFVQAVVLNVHGNPVNSYVRLKGLDAGAVYREECTGRRYGGAALMAAGIPVPQPDGEYQSWQLHLIRE